MSPMLSRSNNSLRPLSFTTAYFDAESHQPAFLAEADIPTHRKMIQARKKQLPRFLLPPPANGALLPKTMVFLSPSCRANIRKKLNSWLCFLFLADDSGGFCSPKGLSIVTIGEGGPIIAVIGSRFWVASNLALHIAMAEGQ